MTRVNTLTFLSYAAPIFLEYEFDRLPILHLEPLKYNFTLKYSLFPPSHKILKMLQVNLCRGRGLAGGKDT